MHVGDTLSENGWQTDRHGRLEGEKRVRMPISQKSAKLSVHERKSTRGNHGKRAKEGHLGWFAANVCVSLRLECDLEGLIVPLTEGVLGY